MGNWDKSRRQPFAIMPAAPGADLGKPMRAAEIAARMGVDPTTFYRNRERYRLIDKMPAPISEVGQPKWDRASMEAWLTRNDPRRPKVIANDALPPPMPNTDADWNAFLHQHYCVPAE